MRNINGFWIIRTFSLHVRMHLINLVRLCSTGISTFYIIMFPIKLENYYSNQIRSDAFQREYMHLHQYPTLSYTPHTYPPFHLISCCPPVDPFALSARSAERSNRRWKASTTSTAARLLLLRGPRRRATHCRDRWYGRRARIAASSVAATPARNWWR